MAPRTVKGQDAQDPRDAFALTASQLALLLSETRDNNDNDRDTKTHALVALGGVRMLERTLRVTMARGIDSASVATRRDWFGRNCVAPPRFRSRGRITLRVIFKGTAPTSLLFLLAFQLLVNALTKGDNWGEVACILALGVALTVIKVRVETENDQRARAVLVTQDDVAVRVRRDGHVVVVARRDLVVGDMVQLTAGRLVPADGLVVDMEEPIAVDESTITGESELTTKSLASTGQEQDAVVWAGTTVQRGRGYMMVLCVGDQTMEGLVLTLISGRRLASEETTASDAYRPLASPSAPEKTVFKPRQGSLEALAKKYRAGQSDAGTSTTKQRVAEPPFFGQLASLQTKLLVLVCIAAVAVMITQIARASEQDFQAHGYKVINEGLAMAISIMVLGTAENIDLVWAMLLAVVSRELKTDHVLLQQYFAPVTAGSVSVLCMDKTGTLTTSTMQVQHVWVASDLAPHITRPVQEAPVDARMLLAHQIVQSASRDHVEDITSADPTEQALLRFAHTQLVSSVARSYPSNVRIVAFTNERKRKSTVVTDPTTTGGVHVMTQGAPDVVLSLCTSIRMADGRVTRLVDTDRNAILAGLVDHWAQQGQRVLAFAYRDLSAPRDDGVDMESIETMTVDAIETELTLLAVVALENPVRPEAPQAVKMLQDAGISICMVTGDHLTTAMAVARQCGIVHGTMVDESGLSAMDAGLFRELVTDINGDIKQADFDRVWPQLRVLARATPADKYLLVDALKATKLHGCECVAVTGNGTNDAAALKHSELGIALGTSSTDVSKRASEVVLLDDNLVSIARVIAWGRVGQAVVLDVLLHQLIAVVVVLTLTLVASCLGMYSPLDGSQIVWIKLCMNVLAAVGLGAAPQSKLWAETMAKPPLRIDAAMVSLRSWGYVAGHAMHQLGVLLVLLYWGDTLFGVPSGQTRLRRRDATVTRALATVSLESTASSLSSAFIQSPSSVHLTIVFNTFVWMQLFLLLRPSRLRADSLTGLLDRNHRSFFIAWLVLGGLQVVVVEFSGNGFNCEPLSLVQWLASVAIAASSLLVETYLPRRV